MSLWLEHLAGLTMLLEAVTRVHNPSSLCTHWSPCRAGCSVPTAGTGSGASGGAVDKHGEWCLDKLRHMLMELLQLQMCLCGLTTLPLLATVPSVLTALPLFATAPSTSLPAWPCP